jgi:peroxiredoxin
MAEENNLLKLNIYKMNNLKLIFLICLTISFSFSQAAQLKINVKPYKEIKENEYALCIDRAGAGDGMYDAFDTMYISKTSHFEVNNIQKGRYQIAIMHPSSDILFYNIYFSDNNSVVEMNVELDQITIPTKIDSIRIVGEFNGWDYSENYLKMKYDARKKYWFLPENEMKKELGVFYFVINEYTKKHSPELSIAPKKSFWADYQNTIKPSNKKIIFVLGNFKQSQPKHKFTITGNDEDYSMIYDSLKSMIENVSIHYSKTISEAETLVDYKTIYYDAELTLRKLSEKYDKSFPWLFTEAFFKIYDYSPVEIEAYLVRNNSLEYQRICTGNNYFANIKNKALILKGIQNPELAITPELISRISFFPHYLSMYDLYDELEIPYGYIENLLSELKKESANQELCGTIEYLKAHSISYYRPDKVKNIYLGIKEHYPKFSYVRQGLIDKELKSLSITAGQEAPKFKITTLDGKEIELSSLKGKYVFIDFWGTWCAPCREEIPNIKKMFETIPSDELVIIGIVYNDKAETINKYISKNDIKYINALATEEIISDYGVNSFPSTFLIDKEGKIKGKDLRGTDLANIVKELMR